MPWAHLRPEPRGRGGRVGTVSGVDRSVTRLLILGGTAEARALAGEVVAWPRLRLVSSLAGRVRDPRLPAGEVRVGGFGGADGLAAWLIEHGIDVLVDATHPYASRMRISAVRAAAAAGVP